MAEKQFNLWRDMRLTYLGFFLLLTFGAADAFAGSGGHGRGESGNPFLRNAALERNIPTAEQQGPRPGELRRGRFLELPQESSGYDSQGDSGSGSQDNSRRQGKLSPEERRTLRRQIDEVGHDIYSPKR